MWDRQRVVRVMHTRTWTHGSESPDRRVVRELTKLVLLGLVTLLIIGCERETQARMTVRVTGASTVYPIVQMAGEALQEQGLIHVEAHAGGSTRGYEDTLAGRNDLGAMARELLPEEAHNVQAFPIAYDGVGIVVHASNTATGITTEQLQRIYRKAIVNWTKLGGVDAEIVVVSKAEGHATLQTFLDHIQLDRSNLRADVVGGDNAQVIRVVANTPHAIGFVSMGEVIHSIEVGMPLRLMALDGIAPTLHNVANKVFPMYRTLYLVSRTEPQGASRVLLDYLRSAAGKAVIERGKYVPLS